jgi:hypothetical protein
VPSSLYNINQSKILKLDYNTLNLYLRNILVLDYNVKLIIPRHVQLSNIFKYTRAYTPQGRVNVRILLSQYRVGFKAGMFATTKKPFNFRPKIKKQKR